MQVLKFGGSSVANAENINKTLAIIKNASSKGRTIIIVSALGGTTDALLQCGAQAAAGDENYREALSAIAQRHLDTVKSLVPLTRQSAILSHVKTRCNELEDICNGVFLLAELSSRTKDKIVSFGELLSSQIISAAMAAEGMPNAWIDSRSLIVTDSNYGYAAVDFTQTQQQMNAFFAAAADQLFIAPGFIASDAHGITTTLGRGGSDYTAAIFAAAMHADLVEIWTDVSGMMTADPRIVPNARVIPRISYQEAMELSHFGAKVIYPPTIQPVMRLGIPVWIKNTFHPEDNGTLIEKFTQQLGGIRGISSINKIALLSLEGGGMVGIPGFSKRLFEALANEKINVILITQGSSEHAICVGIDENNADAAKRAVDNAFDHEIKTGRVDPLIIEKGLAIAALVGDNMKSHPGTSGKMFGALGRNGINVRAIAQGSSERNISAVIAATDVKKAINVLHEAFFETTYKQLNLFIAGAGNVGSRLLDQLKQQQQYLLDQLRLQVRVIGIGNSRKMLFDDDGIDLNSWKTKLNNDGTPMDLDAFIHVVRSKNLRNAVFADITANDVVATKYGGLLQKAIAVVACNKVACSSDYAYYRELKKLSREYDALFLFETNVGAGLPVIGTLNDLLRSGDTVTRIEAVLSGTLNFVFNNYDGSRPFAQVVKQAQDEGYTEPDPRLDLGGTDVMRKIMILARESGAKLDMTDISNNSFMPASCMQGTVDDFYQAMEKEEAHFKSIYERAAKAGKKLKFVASYADGKASVGLQEVSSQHDFYNLFGKDNVVLFYTTRYPEQPLVVKGAGAGAEVTASGVFADIIRAARV